MTDTDPITILHVADKKIIDCKNGVGRWKEATLDKILGCRNWNPELEKGISTPQIRSTPHDKSSRSQR